jgi:GT2 family glycosyltransferase
VSRPGVSVVMPFAGSAAEAQRALDALLALDAGPDDELILSDNSGVCPPSDRVTVVRAAGESSPSHARNVGAEYASREWVLFLDADCRAEPRLIENYLAHPVADDVGALAGEVVPASQGFTFAARYGAARSFLGQSAHLAHSYMPRAVAANLLVRRSAFEQIGGFYEGVRAAEDTDFSWRLQRAGWRLEYRPRARVEHEYRTSLEGLRRQWRGYAAGRAWLGRRYEDFEPQPALRRAGARVLGRGRGRAGAAAPPRRTTPVPRRDRAAFVLVDAMLGVEELAGFALSNRPRKSPRELARVVLVAERFPAREDPLADFARRLVGARVEAASRPEVFDQRLARELVVDYREDDGLATRVGALLRLVARHPIRCVLDWFRRDTGAPGLLALAPAVRRLGRDPAARVHPLGGDEVRATARRLSALSGRPLEDDRS